MSRFFSSKKKEKQGAKTPSPRRAQTAEEDVASRMSLPGSGYGFFDMTSYDKDVKESDLDKALKQHMQEAQSMAKKLKARALRTDGQEHPTAELEEMLMETYALKDCFFIGHTNTDMDSIASAVGAAELFGGTATRSEREVNGEIEFSCEYAGVELPPYFDDVKGASDPNNTKQGIVLVDHNEPGQMIASLGEVAFPGSGASKEDLEKSMLQSNRIKGVIDHHALSDKFSTSAPLFVDIRPWGSACSIVAHQYVRLGRPIPKHVCVLLLCGILSDTINLTSPTTTHADKVMATLLGLLGEEHHPNKLAEEMFKAKTAHLTKLTPYAIVRADQKNFTMGEYNVGWATIEVNDPLPILAKSRKLLLELRVLKKEKELDFVFLSVVDLQKKETKLLLCGELEVAIAKEVFGGKTSSALDYVPAEEEPEPGCSHADHSHADNSAEGLEHLHEVLHVDAKESLMDIGNLVSRKKEFVPPLKKVLAAGWKPSRKSVRIAKEELAPHVHTEHACGVDGQGCTIRRTFSIDENAQDGSHAH